MFYKFKGVSLLNACLVILTLFCRSIGLSIFPIHISCLPVKGKVISISSPTSLRACMTFKKKDENSLIPWSKPESTYNDWRRMSKADLAAMAR